MELPKFGIFAPGEEGKNFRKKIEEKKEISGQEGKRKGAVEINTVEITRESTKKILTEVNSVFNENIGKERINKLIDLVEAQIEHLGENPTKDKAGDQEDKSEMERSLKRLEIAKAVLSIGGNLDVAGKLMSSEGKEYVRELSRSFSRVEKEGKSADIEAISNEMNLVVKTWEAINSSDGKAAEDTAGVVKLLKNDLSI